MVRRAVPGSACAPLLVLALALLLAFLPGAPARALSGIEAALRATLVIYTDDLDEAFLGSGFLYGDGSLAVTNQHVVGEAASVELRSSDGRHLSARVLARDASRDIALIEVPGAVFGLGLEPAAALPPVGAPVYALGAPLGAEFTVTRGMISAVGRQISDAAPVRYLQHDAAVNPGSSGGPLVSEDGRLVGMNSAIADGSRLFAGIGYAMTVSDIGRLTGLMLSGELRPVPQLGMRARPVTRKIALALGLAQGQGLLIDAVTTDGLADAAGLRAGDILLALGGRPVTGAGELAFLIETRSSDLPELAVRRGGETLRLLLNLSGPVHRLSKLSLGQGPARIDSYSFASLGVTLEDSLVSSLNPGSPAAHAGLAAGDQILLVNGAGLSGADLAGYSIRGPLVLLVQRDQTTVHIIIDPWSRGRASRPIGGANVLDPDVVIF